MIKEHPLSSTIYILFYFSFSKVENYSTCIWFISHPLNTFFLNQIIPCRHVHWLLLHMTKSSKTPFDAHLPQMHSFLILFFLFYHSSILASLCQDTDFFIFVFNSSKFLPIASLMAVLENFPSNLMGVWGSINTRKAFLSYNHSVLILYERFYSISRMNDRLQIMKSITSGCFLSTTWNTPSPIPLVLLKLHMS